MIAPREAKTCPIMSRQYISAGQIVQNALYGRIPIKEYCAQIPNIGKVDYAIALETLKFRDVLRNILQKCHATVSDLQVSSEGLLLVLSYELLFGAGKISGGGQVKRILVEHQLQMQEVLAEMMIGKSSHADLLPERVRQFNQLESFIRINEKRASPTDGLLYIQSACPEAVADDLIPFLVRTPPLTKSFAMDPWVKNGNLIIQDKASCFPSQILLDSWDGGDVIDACAAPGQKTGHIACSLLNRVCNSGNNISIFAFDKSPKRAALLRDRMRIMGLESVVAITQADFLNVKPTAREYSDVRSILVDPSCLRLGCNSVYGSIVRRRGDEQ